MGIVVVASGAAAASATAAAAGSSRPIGCGSSSSCRVVRRSRSLAAAAAAAGGGMVPTMMGVMPGRRMRARPWLLLPMALLVAVLLGPACGGGCGGVQALNLGPARRDGSSPSSSLPKGLPRRPWQQQQRGRRSLVRELTASGNGRLSSWLLSRRGGSSSSGGSSAGQGETLWDEKRDVKCKFVVITGGVISGIGKGVTASSLGLLLKMMGLRPTAIKIDPYLNVDAGTMSPFEHGEVFVLDDGGETDLDLGNYERFLHVRLTNDSNLTTGKIYQSVIERERRGDYLGKTVQVVPHITNEIQDWILRVATRPVDGTGQAPNVCVIELGGTLGDIESMPFVEALRQLQDKVGYKNCCFLHVSMVPTVGSEQKTKPTQHSVRQMRALGLIPDFLICRGAHPLGPEAREKLSAMCQVPPEHVVSVHDVPSTFRVPLLLKQQGLHLSVLDRLRIPRPGQEECTPPATTNGNGNNGNTANGASPFPLHEDKGLLQQWETIASTVEDPALPPVRIAVVGKYTGLRDSYLSIEKALQHAAIATRQRLQVEYMDSSEPGLEQRLHEGGFHGLLVPGGFGTRGLDGKVGAIRWAREARIPFLGICLGMQAAVIEYARTVLGRPHATSTEFVTPATQAHVRPGVDDVVVFMPEGDRTKMGGTMRLGARTTLVAPGGVAYALYREAEGEQGDGGGVLRVDERHRHRYEVNPDLVPELEAAGLRFTGRDETGRRMEILELAPPQDGSAPHPYFVAAQFHPEFRSRPTQPSPLFLGLLRAAAQRREALAASAAVAGAGQGQGQGQQRVEA